jgi:cytochrome c oxidase assembly protein subunit 17
MGNTIGRGSGPQESMVLATKDDDASSDARIAVSLIDKEAAAGPPGAAAAAVAPKKKICCACPETKRLRDECVTEHGQEACTKWIDAHLQCLRNEGFKV